MLGEGGGVGVLCRHSRERIAVWGAYGLQNSVTDFTSCSLVRARHSLEKAELDEQTALRTGCCCFLCFVFLLTNRAVEEEICEQQGNQSCIVAL